MPESPGSLLLVHLVEKQDEGYRFVRGRDTWPLHITLAPWFMVADERLLSRRLAQVAGQVEPFSVRVGMRELFGAKRNIPVNVIEDQTDIKKLHEVLVALLRKDAAEFYQETWIGDAYRAHITRHENAGKWCNEGDIEDITDFHLVRLNDGNECEVVQRFKLEGLMQ